jgi:hypothetical protein
MSEAGCLRAAEGEMCTGSDEAIWSRERECRKGRVRLYEDWTRGAGWRDAAREADVDEGGKLWEELAYIETSRQRLGNGIGGTWCLARSLAAVERGPLGNAPATRARGAHCSDPVSSRSVLNQ